MPGKVTIRNIGDKVWVPRAEYTKVWEQCPDCLGTKHWHCVVPNGEEFDIECPRCFPGGREPSTGRIGERYEHRSQPVEAKIVGIEQCENGIQYTTDAGRFDEDSVFDDMDSAGARADRDAEKRKEREFKEMSRIARSKGRPRKNAVTGAHEADHAEGPHSIVYAKSQIRHGLGEAKRWYEFAKRKGSVIDLKKEIAKCLSE